MQDDIQRNIAIIRERIRKAAIRAGRDPEEITLVAVTKGVSADRIKIAYDCGLRIFGENYVQEAMRKMEILPSDIIWHFIGRIQRNKVKYIAGRYALVHSIDSLSLCEEFQKHCEKRGITMDFLIEVNLAGERTKGGIPSRNTLSFIKDVLKYKSLSMKGLMIMPPYSENPEDSRRYFREIRELRDNLIEEGISEEYLRHLSMGMSGDFEVAIEEGATIVRIGTAIFGPRA